MTKAKTKTRSKEPTLDDGLFAPAEPRAAAPAPEAPAKAAGKSVAVRKPTARTAPAAQPVRLPASPVAVMEMIERVASSATVNPDNLEKLLSLQERIMDRQARLDFNENFVAMAPKLPQVTKDGRIVVREKDSHGRRTGEKTQDTPYAKWETISPMIVPILSAHGFSIRHRTESAPDGKIRIIAILYGHGHQEESYMDFELDGTGSKNNAQARVSATTYGRRITASTIINLVARGEDDDGKQSGDRIVAGDPLTPEQLAQLLDMIEAVACPTGHLMAHLNKTKPKAHPAMQRIEDLPASRFDEAIADLRSYESNKRDRDAAASGAKVVES